MWVLLYRFCSELMGFLVVQKFWKSVTIWQSYRKFKGEQLFETQYILDAFWLVRLTTKMCYRSATTEVEFTKTAFRCSALSVWNSLVTTCIDYQKWLAAGLQVLAKAVAQLLKVSWVCPDSGHLKHSGWGVRDKFSVDFRWDYRCGYCCCCCFP